MKVGYYSPLPPARTGVADYAAALLRGLRRLGDVEPGASDADVNLYQLGNNQLHRETYSRAIAEPGVVMLHDAVLQHFFLGSLSAEQYIDEFVYNYGEWSRDLAASLWQRRAGSGADVEYFRYPMLRRIAETSRAIVVHNPAAAEMVKAHCETATIVEIPHLLEAPQLPPPRDRARRPFLFGVFGHLRESKRILPLLRAYSGVRRHTGDISLLVAGDCVSTDLARAMEPWIDQPGIIRVGYAPERDFWQNAQSVDACINLRYPAAGETSGIAIRLMGIGKPVVITRGVETSRFPEAACLRVDEGPAEQDMLAEFMLWLCTFPEHASGIGERAAAHIREFHSLDRVAALYWETLLKSVT